jgi:uncharacterized protein (DUF302 family)
MRRRPVFLMVLVFLLALCTAAHAGDLGVYVKAVEKAEGTFDGTVKAVEEALQGSGWQVLASYESGVSEECALRAHNIVMHSTDYSAKVMSHGAWSAFALPMRVGVYEDEGGINIAFVNPASINRTVLGDGVDEELSLSTMNELSDIISSAVTGSVVKEQIGQIRDKGRVGGMGGGDFQKKVEEIHSGEDFAETAQKVKESILANDKGWELIYALPLEGFDAIIYGVTKKETEAKAFDIAGEKRESKDYRCPGLDHAAAFPIEVIVYKEGDAVKVVILDEMYRMKVYFQDAGNWAFMKNMGMPGRIEREVVEISTAGLK